MASGVRDDVSHDYTCFMRWGEDTRLHGRFLSPRGDGAKSRLHFLSPPMVIRRSVIPRTHHDRGEMRKALDPGFYLNLVHDYRAGCPATLSPLVPIHYIKVYSPARILLVHGRRYSD
jgi:hypothetical protein